MMLTGYQLPVGWHSANAISVWIRGASGSSISGPRILCAFRDRDGRGKFYHLGLWRQRVWGNL